MEPHESHMISSTTCPYEKRSKRKGERVRGSPRFHLDGKGKLNEKRERRGRKGKRRTRGEEA